jgi:hypothetical protein
MSENQCWHYKGNLKDKNWIFTEIKAPLGYLDATKRIYSGNNVGTIKLDLYRKWQKRHNVNDKNNRYQKKIFDMVLTNHNIVNVWRNCEWIWFQDGLLLGKKWCLLANQNRYRLTYVVISDWWLVDLHPAASISSIFRTRTNWTTSKIYQEKIRDRATTFDCHYKSM